MLMMKPMPLWVTVLMAALAVVHGSTNTKMSHEISANANHPDQDQQRQLQLQRVAQLCADNATPFATSIFVNLLGDNTPFTEADLDTLLGLSLAAYNQANANQCDPTFRTLQSVSVTEVFYTDALDYIRLRLDVGGFCEGCLGGEGSNEVGPLFGGAERLLAKRNRQLLLRQRQQQAPTPQSRGRRGIKGSRVTRDLQRGGKPKKGNGDDEDGDGSDVTSQQQGGDGPVVTSQQEDDGACGCANSQLAVSDRRGPTESEFAMALNAAILQARADNTLSGAASVEEIFEAGVIGTSTVVGIGGTAVSPEVASNCAAKNDLEFTTNMWLAVEGTELTEPEIIPVEVALMEAFNEVNFVTCDTPYFRKISDVSYEGARQGPNGVLEMSFAITGICVNCDPAAVTLFDLTDGGDGTVPVLVQPDREFRPPSRSRLVSEIEWFVQAQSGPVLITRDATTACACPLNQPGLAGQRPTESEFATVLSAALEILAAEGLQSSIQGILSAVEGVLESNCPSEPTEWITTVFADFDGRPSLLANTEIAALEAGFKDNYNEPAFDGCDAYFRVIQEVRLIPGITRRRSLQGTSTGSAVNSTDVVDLQSELPSIFLVAGQCRNCPVTNAGTFSMFDDAFRLRQLIQADREVMRAQYYDSVAETKTTADFTDFMSGRADKNKNQRRLQEDCSCAPGTEPSAPYAPTAADFAASYNVKIADLKNQGIVTNINGVLALQEVAPYIATVGFSIFYGSLENLGTPSEAEFDELAYQTTAFYRNRLEAEPLEFKSVQVTWIDSVARTDLDRLQVNFVAEFIFEESSNLPSREDLTEVMESFNYVDYITDYVWKINPIPTSEADSKNPPANAFATSHTVLFTGTEDVVVDLQMAFTVRSDRMNRLPSAENIDGLVEQVNVFFLNKLTEQDLLVMAFDAGFVEKVEFDSNGRLLTVFDAIITFSKEDDHPTADQMSVLIRSVNLDEFQNQYLVGSDYFGETVQVAFSG